MKLFGLFDQYKGLRKEVYIMFIGRIATRFGSMVASMLTLILNQKMGMSATQVSVFMLISTAFSVLLTLLGGKLADKYNKKNIIIFFDIVSISLYFVCAFMELNYLSIAFIVVAAASQWAERPAYDAIIADITTTDDREKAYALQYLGTNIGMLVAPTLAGFLFKNYLWLLFIICGCAISVSTVLIAFKVRNLTPIVEADKLLQRRRDGDSIWKVLMDNKLLILYFVAMGLYAAGYDQYTYLMPLDIGRMYGEDGGVIYGTVSSTNCLVVIIFSPIILKLFAGMKPIKKVLEAQFMLVFGFLVFMNFMKYIPAYYVAIWLFTFGEIFAMLGGQPYMAAHAPASHRGRLSSINTFTHRALSSLLLLVIGRIYDGAGSIPAWSFVLGIMGLAICLTIILCVKDKSEA